MTRAQNPTAAVGTGGEPEAVGPLAAERPAPIGVESGRDRQVRSVVDVRSSLSVHQQPRKGRESVHAL